MIKITKAILILTMLKICFSTNNGIDVRYLEKKDIFSIRLTKQYFKLMKKDKSGSITLPYLFSSPALTNKISDDVRDNKNFIPSHITYRFNFITSIGDSTDYNQIEVIQCNISNTKVRTISIKRKYKNKQMKENDVLKVDVDRKATNICFQVMDFEKMVVVGTINIPLYREQYIDWQNQYKFGHIDRKVKVGTQIVIRLHITDNTKVRHYYFQNHNQVIGNPNSKLRISSWEQKLMKATNYMGLWRNEGNKHDIKSQGHNQFRFFVTKPGTTVLKFVQRDQKNMRMPISLVIVKIIAHQ